MFKIYDALYAPNYVRGKGEKEMKEKKMNNKGFSLVELIIVIAIMAILIVVLAPQYLKYVEKSRNSTDVSNATEMVTAMQVYAADPDVKASDAFVGDKTFTITVSSTGTAVTGDNATAAKKAFFAAGMSASDSATPTTTCVSKTNWNTYTITGSVAGNGSISFTYGASGATGSDDAFKNLMSGKSGS